MITSSIASHLRPAMSTMRRIACCVAIGLATFLTPLGIVQAELEEGGVRFDAPFAFTVNERQLPAGVYMLRELTPRVLMLVGEGETMVFTGKPLALEPQWGSSEVIFHGYGDQQFLAQIRPRGTTYGYSAPIGSREGNFRNAGLTATVTAVPATGAAARRG
jgi:hypothetical protein